MASSAIKKILGDATKLREVASVAFKSVDVDDSGSIDMAELRGMMEKIAGDMGADPPFQDDVQEVMAQLDTNGDGVLSLDEFVVLVRDSLTAMLE